MYPKSILCIWWSNLVQTSTFTYNKLTIAVKFMIANLFMQTIYGGLMTQGLDMRTCFRSDHNRKFHDHAEERMNLLLLWLHTINGVKTLEILWEILR